jgi:thiol:disulfide interchange protein DsbC
MFKSLLFALPLLLAGVAQAGEVDELEKQLAQTLPGVSVQNLQKVDGVGLYEGVINGEVLYFSADGRYALQGELVSR